MFNSPQQETRLQKHSSVRGRPDERGLETETDAVTATATAAGGSSSATLLASFATATATAVAGATTQITTATAAAILSSATVVNTATVTATRGNSITDSTTIPNSGPLYGHMLVTMLHDTIVPEVQTLRDGIHLLHVTARVPAATHTPQDAWEETAARGIQ